MRKQIGRAVRHPMWRAGLRSGLILGILVGLALPGALRWVDAQHAATVAAQWEADFGPSRRLAEQVAEQRLRNEEAIGRHEARYGQEPVVGGRNPRPGLYDPPLGR